MTWDDLVYALLLLFSLLFGIGSSYIDKKWKKYYCCIIGLIFAIFVAGQAIWHSLLISLVSVALILLQINHFQFIIFIFSFSYLLFFRSCHYFNFQKPPSYSNAIQLVLTLKVVSAGYEVFDTKQRKKAIKKIENMSEAEMDDEYREKLLKLKAESNYYDVEPSFVDLFCYFYCYVGFLTGPFFKLRVFLDNVSHWPEPEPIKTRVDLVIPKLQSAAFFGLVYLIVSHFYYIEYARSGEILTTTTIIYRVYFMMVMFSLFRFRMYFAWLVSESVCICSGLGGYPACTKPQPGHGPTDIVAVPSVPPSTPGCEPYDYSTIRNLSVNGCEWAPTIRESMRSWNRTVQYWLAAFVYKRCPIRSIRTGYTMLVSAFWHGIHPGYYLSFMTVPLGMRAEDALYTLLHGRQNDVNRFHNRIPLDDHFARNLLTDWKVFFRWFYRVRVIDVCSIGFLLLSGSATLDYWASTGWYIHISLAVLIGLDYFWLKHKKQKEEDEIEVKSK